MNKLTRELINITGEVPNNIAIFEGDSQIIYKDFLGLVKSLAEIFFLSFKENGSQCIALACDKNKFAYAAKFASLMAGGFYVSIDRNLPKSIVKKILKKTTPAAVFFGDDKPFDYPIQVEGINIEDVKARSFEREVEAHRIAYVKFTSGTTGEPKGVIISQRAMNFYVSWVQDAFRPSYYDRWSQHPSTCFDISVTDTFGALTSGGRLYPIKSLTDLSLPAEWIRENEISIWNSVPSVLNMMSKAKQITHTNLSSVRLFNFCGEVLYKSQVDELFEAAPAALVQNTYGPTEATVACTSIKLDKRSFKNYPSTAVELGNDLPSVKTFVVENELLIMGEQLAEGYLNDQTTTRKFFFHNLNGLDSGLCYRSGDLVRTDDSGRVFFVERRDKQVKVRGHRVELSAVTVAIRECGYEECLVGFEDPNIIAFVVAEELDVSELKSRLLNLIEKEAVPVQIIKVQELARNQNFKLDSKVMIEKYKSGCFN